ncbi:hypothetical protein [Vibrio metschnikovii]|uniref:Uncharacterized protein n=1 Tax=bacterium 19MO02SH05 TaxID=2920696 RepID=A0AAU6TNF4_UNCXX|nr:hypothetical protein [Vibrio metschnikovii]EKO3719218.1 hypothetical protein [Vibrio metschnikovii]
MSKDTLEILTMLGTWFSGIGAFSAVMFALHSNKPRLKVKFRGQSKLEIMNQRPVNAHISHIYHLIDGTSDRRIGSFSPYRIILGNNSREDEALDQTVLSGEFSIIHLNSKVLIKSYIKQCQYSKVEVPKCMPKMYICVRLVTGKIYKLEAPLSFYKDVQYSYIDEPMRAIESLTDSNVVRGPSFDAVRSEVYSHTLERYSAAYKANMLWTLPKNKSLTKRLRQIRNAWHSQL